MAGKQIPLSKRFWTKVAKAGDDECWPWLGAVHRNGYGAVRPNGTPNGCIRKNTGAHRAAYELANGPIPDGLVVLHKCDNRRCCNPAHLAVGTQAENMADMYAKGRAPLGERSGKNVLTENDVRAIRALLGKETHMQIGSRFGVAGPTISKIANRTRWAHVT